MGGAEKDSVTQKKGKPNHNKSPLKSRGARNGTGGLPLVRTKWAYMQKKEPNIVEERENPKWTRQRM